MNRVKKIIHTNYAYRTGLSGQNVTVVVMDTGIVRHPDFGNRILLFRDFCNGRQGLYDDNGHGTHVNDLKNKQDEKQIKQVNTKINRPQIGLFFCSKFHAQNFDTPYHQFSVQNFILENSRISFRFYPDFKFYCKNF